MKKPAYFLIVLIAFIFPNTQVSSQDVVNASTLNNKIMAGYQGWFGASGDGSGYGWIHWSRGATPAADNITFDMWPDLREYEADELFDTDFVYPDLSNAGLYSAYKRKTVERHVKWMKDYDIDGAFVQRFIISAMKRTDQRDTVLQNVRHAAEEHGRVFANMYDMSGAKPESFASDVIQDWKHLVDDLKITESPNYLHHNGLPVLSLWGVHAGNSKDIITAAMWAELLQWFTVDAPEKYKVTLKAGVNNGWRTDSQQWQAIYDHFDFISPWAVGRYSDKSGADTYRNQYFQVDLNETASRNMEYIPVVFPGFSWANKYPGKVLNQIPRNGGDFFWHQIYNAIDAGCNMVYVAMFDEVDEGTAIFKIAENDTQIPTTGNFVTLDVDGIELPSDWYLRLTGEGTKMLRGEIPLTATIPIVPFPDNAAFISQEVPTIMAPGATISVSISMKNSGTNIWSETDNYRLGYSIDPENAIWSIIEAGMNQGETIEPGGSKTFTFEITAPEEVGVYKFQWGMKKDSLSFFGELSDSRLINISSSIDFLDDCDALTGWNQPEGLILNNTHQKQGTACIEFNGGTGDSIEFQKVFDIPYAATIVTHEAVLQFWYYTSDASLIDGAIEVQLGSGGKLDTDTYNWVVLEPLTGWNLVTLYAREADTIGTPDLNAINWFHIRNQKTGDVITRMDEILIFDKNAGAVKHGLLVNSGTGDGNYVENEIIKISADEAPPAQQFVRWIIDSGEPLIEDANAENTTLRMPAGNVELSANYKVLGIFLDDCDLLKDWGSSGVIGLNSTDQKEGLGCLEFTGSATDEYKKVFSTPYNSGATKATGRLEFWYFVSDPSQLEESNQVEIGSAGRADYNEYNWNIGELSTGWNFISLELSEASITREEPDLSAINWFRIYHFKSGLVTTRIDAIEIVDPAAGERYPLTVYDGTGDGNYFQGTEVTIVADPPPEGLMFDSWVIESGNPEFADARLPTSNILMPGSATIIRATYMDIQMYALIVNNGDGSGSYLPGQTFYIVADAAPEGEVFDKWVVDSGSPSIANENAALTTVTMTTGDAVITATYINPNVSAESVTWIGYTGAIYPNPAGEEITISLTVEEPTAVSISIYDLRGRKVGKAIQNMNLSPGDNRLRMPLSEVETGTYLMKIKSDEGQYVELFHHF